MRRPIRGGGIRGRMWPFPISPGQGAAIGSVEAMTRTTTRVKGRDAARKRVLEKKDKLDAERRRREEQETDLAADFFLGCDDRERALAAVQAAEVKMGRVIEEMVGSLRLPYSRLVDLFELPETELKRMRQLAEAESSPAAGAVGRRREGTQPATVAEAATAMQPVAGVDPTRGRLADVSPLPAAGA